MKQYVVSKITPPFGKKGNRRHHQEVTQKVRVYDTIDAAGTDGLDRRAIATAVGLAPDRISFYLSELRRAGYITVKGDPTTVSPTMEPDEAAFAALLGLENALIARARVQTTPEMDRAFVKYQKIKELALRPGTGSEGRVALRMAMIELIKVVL